MRKLFYLGLIGLVSFEIANVWFIMPLPFSQQMRSIDVAYALYSWRWAIRIACSALIVIGLLPAWRHRGWTRWLVPVGLLLAGGVAYMTNFVMSADRMFLAPETVNMQPAERNSVEMNRLVVGIEVDGEARAYPVQFIGYHHQVRDMVGGQPVLVSYCTVCRTGRVFDPTVNGLPETFRLVGMDHFNAMFEDRSTGSWWRQANGQAVTGARAGAAMREIPSRQVTLAAWLAIHPHSLIMQADSALSDRYSSSYDFETGVSRSTLTGTDTTSWGEKSWVVGVTVAGQSRAYDWNRLRRERIINDTLGGTPLLIVLADDNASYFAYERPDAAMRFAVRGDSLIESAMSYDLAGRGPRGQLQPISASQEFWHSWRTFQPRTTRY